MAKNWADLLPELLELCSGQLLLEDWLAFRSVCSAWRAAAFEERFDVPWLMLVDDGRNNTERAELYSLFSSRIHKVVLPEGKRKRCSSSRGWIFTIDTDSKVHMLNPLSRAASRDIIKLPRVNKLFHRPPQYYESITRRTKFVLSASPASSPNYMVMAMPIYSRSTGLGLWKSGTKEWKVLAWQRDPVLDVVFYKGKFFAVNWSGDILAYDLDGLLLFV